MKSTNNTLSEDNLAFLRMMEGKFKGEVTFQDPTLSAYEKEDLNDSIMENTFIYDSHFLKEDFHGKDRKNEKVLLGTGFIGFNNNTAEFEGFWIDNQNQAMNFDIGKKQGNALIMQWENESSHHVKIRHSRSTTVIDNDHHTIDFFQENGQTGKVKTLSMAFVRQ